MKFTNQLAAILVLGIIAGCSGTKPPARPEWVNSMPAYRDAYAQVGVSTSTGIDSPAENRMAAEIDGKQKIAGIIKTKVQALTEQWSQRNLAKSPDANDSRLKSMTENVSRQVVDATLAGCIAKEYYEDEKGHTYVLMIMPKASVWDVAKKDLKEELNQEPAWLKQSIEQKNEALGRMDEIFGKEMQTGTGNALP